MDKKQKALIQWGIRRNLHELATLEAGQYPEWAKAFDQHEALSLEKRRMYADWCLNGVLRGLLPALPKDLRTQVEACIETRQRIWSEEYQKAYYQAQKEARLRSLQEEREEHAAPVEKDRV